MLLMFHTLTVLSMEDVTILFQLPTVSGSSCIIRAKCASRIFTSFFDSMHHTYKFFLKLQLLDMENTASSLESTVSYNLLKLAHTVATLPCLKLFNEILVYLPNTSYGVILVATEHYRIGV